MTENNRKPPPRQTFQVRDASLSATLHDRLAAELRERRELLERAVREAPHPNALEAIGREAHRLAGACAYCGERRLQHAALALETAANAAQTDHLHHMWREVARLFAQILGQADPSA